MGSMGRGSDCQHEQVEAVFSSADAEFVLKVGIGVTILDPDTCQTCAGTIDDPIPIKNLPFSTKSSTVDYDDTHYVDCLTK